MAPIFRKPSEQDLEDEYIGNIWGWKFSRIALIIIFLLVLWVVIRYFQYKDQIPVGPPKIEQINE